MELNVGNSVLCDDFKHRGVEIGSHGTFRCNGECLGLAVAGYEGKEGK